MPEKKKAQAQEALSKAVDAFLQLQPDARTVHGVEQRLELHITNTTAYIPSYTRQAMDASHGAPIQAVYTKTDKANKQVFIYPADNVSDTQARKLRSDETMGPASFAFGVPLRTLQIRIPASRRIILPLNAMEVPDYGTVYCASFADIEKETRSLEAVAAAKQTKAPEAPNQGENK